MQLTLWSLPPLAVLIVAGITHPRVRALNAVPGRDGLEALVLCVGAASAAQLFATFFADLDIKMIAAKVQYVGMALLPVAWFVFSVSLVRRRSVRSTAIVALAAIPLATIALALSNEGHHWIWPSTTLTAAPDGFIGATFGYGFAYQIQILYGHSLGFAGTVILLFELAASPMLRRTMWAVVCTWLAVALCNFIYLSPFNPWPWFDPTMLGFAFAALFLDRGLLQVGLLEANPMLRREVVEQLSDAVVIVDRKGHILDLNPAAASLLGLGLAQALRTNISTCLATPMMPKLLLGEDGVVSASDRFYDVKSTVLRSDGPVPVELALVFRDVTEPLRTRERLERVTAELEKAANTDSLTQLSNRRYFRTRLESEIANVERHRTPLSVLLFDLDNFKRVNDTYGHDVGDRVLQVIGNITMEFKRGPDVAARLGGEEFALLLPNTDLAGAVKVAQRLRQTIAEHVISDRNHNPIQVTVSVGVATVSPERPNSDRTLTEADRALYRAKNAGRNCVCTPA
jgi:diguanylate cyclase (GGDEF)-like protein/PAS domain S-box-containing protein